MGMWLGWGRQIMHTEFWWGKLFEDRRGDGRIALGWSSG